MTPITLTTHGHRIDTDPDIFGFLRQSNDLLKDTGFLKNRIEEDGYLFFRDILDHAESPLALSATYRRVDPSEYHVISDRRITRYRTQRV